MLHPAIFDAIDALLMKKGINTDELQQFVDGQNPPKEIGARKLTTQREAHIFEMLIDAKKEIPILQGILDVDLLGRWLTVKKNSQLAWERLPEEDRNII